MLAATALYIRCRNFRPYTMDNCPKGSQRCLAYCGPYAVRNRVQRWDATVVQCLRGFVKHIQMAHCRIDCIDFARLLTGSVTLEERPLGSVAGLVKGWMLRRGPADYVGVLCHHPA